jgi:hypothetical protein
MMLGSTKLSNHMIIMILRVVNSSIPTIENKYTATLPLTITSKINIDGIIEASRYILVITFMALI